MSSGKHLKLNIPNERTEPQVLDVPMVAGEPGSLSSLKEISNTVCWLW